MPSGELQWLPGSSKLVSGYTNGLRLEVTADGRAEELLITGQKGLEGRVLQVVVGDIVVGAGYGAKRVKVPFSLELLDFEMTRYPGTNSPESFASEVIIHDQERGVDRPFRIFMNHILDYRGYRLFQSSYDRDELGTYLSVNHDALGTWTSYLGYALLTLGMLLTLFSKNTRFAELGQRVTKLRNRGAAIAILIAVSWAGQVQGQTVPQIDEDHAERFSELIVQDVRGRMKPMHTLSREILRKIHGSESWSGLNADQVVLSMWTEPSAWYAVEFVKLGKAERLNQLVGVEGDKAGYRDFFNEDGSYKLGDEVARANMMDATEKGVYEKNLISVDERVNIMNMVFSGMLFRLVPVPDDPARRWSSGAHHRSEQPTEVAARFFNSYRSALRTSAREGQYQQANDLAADLDRYQRNQGTDLVPTDAKRSAEIWLNEWKPFNRLALVYLFLGLLFLTLLFAGVFIEKPLHSRWARILTGALMLAFIFHTVGLGLRWYVSGRAPWSNGYESMIYIAWTSTLAGTLFARRSVGALAATNILASVVLLLIAMLSYLNPEITPLVPVLKSYWLTIHVSLEAGSYGFLMLGAIIGLINLLLIATASRQRWKKTRPKIEELSAISEITLTAGLFMQSVGTYLGGVWANESWGRYWGWDAKETWALVSILGYAVILHMRFIPAFRNMFAFNVGTLFGLASVIMTYYGVNYYLSGLHSYAAGDPVPIPQWVYIAVISLVLLSSVAYMRWRRLRSS